MRMTMIRCGWYAALCLLALSAPQAAGAQEKQWSNAPAAVRHNTGTVVILPDGTRLRSRAVLPDGRLVLDNGSTVQIEGMTLNPGDGAVILPEGSVLSQDGTVLLPDGNSLTARQDETVPQEQEVPRPDVSQQEKPLPDVQAMQPEETAQLPTAQSPAAASPDEKLPAGQQAAPAPEKSDAQTARQEPLYLWQMMPLSTIPEEKQQIVAENRQDKPQVKQATPRPAKEPEAQKKVPGEKPGTAKPQSEKKPDAQKAEAQKTSPQKKAPAVKPGEELRIPPEAAKTGNLDFLEGCWQGTRPEYFSKRTIRECFCFGAHGGNGKRRVIDPKGKRTCTGSSKARLDGNGVLHVSSDGAFCDDGERWGASQMTCRGNGQKTPCSWIFTDANGGRQAYQIPFVRVTSCGR